jgi:hypothetical protein
MPIAASNLSNEKINNGITETAQLHLFSSRFFTANNVKGASFEVREDFNFFRLI